MMLLQDGDSPEGTSIEVYSTDTYQNILTTQPEMFSGNYSLEIPQGNYMINYVRPNYKTFTQLINLPVNNPEDMLVLNAALEKEAPMIEETTVLMAAEESLSEPPAEIVAEPEPEPEIEFEPEEKSESVYIPPAVETEETAVAFSTGMYTIQFMASTERVEMEYLEGRYPVEIQHGNDGFYRYITGTYPSLAEAESTHREILGTKYKDAFIRYYNLNDYLSRAALNSRAVYTIQLMALREKSDPVNLEGVDGIKVSYGEDGWYRYTTGEYSTLAAARMALNDVISRGYKGAFIKKLSEISNY
jgi:hypothetical protein